MKFKDYISESPVGSVGRTSQKDAEEFVTPEKLAEFSKIVKKVGGKTVARHMLNMLNSQGDQVSNSGDKTLIN